MTTKFIYSIGLEIRKWSACTRYQVWLQNNVSALHRHYLTRAPTTVTYGGLLRIQTCLVWKWILSKLVFIGLFIFQSVAILENVSKDINNLAVLFFFFFEKVVVHTWFPIFIIISHNSLDSQWVADPLEEEKILLFPIKKKAKCEEGPRARCTCLGLATHSTSDFG